MGARARLRGRRVLMRRCVYAWQGALGSLALHGYRRVALGGALARGDEGLRRSEGALVRF